MKIIPNLHLILALAGSVFLAQDAGASSLVASGAWDDSSIWSSDGIPTASDDASIDDDLTALVSAPVSGTASRLSVGNTGTGSLIINGGTVSDSNGFIGDSEVGSNGTVTVTSGAWSNTSDLLVGYTGAASLSINGGTVSDSKGTIGELQYSNGTATVTSGTWSNTTYLVVGAAGIGSLIINGGTVSDSNGIIGSHVEGSGTANVTGGTWSSTSQLAVGVDGIGILNLTDNGIVSVKDGKGKLFLAHYATSVGTLNIGTGGIAGTLLAKEVTGGAGIATVNFNHTGTLTFAALLSDDLTVNKEGLGVTILTANNSYSGETTVEQGTLFVNGSPTGAGAVQVQSGARLGGTGSISAPVTIQAGGILRGGAETLGKLTLSGDLYLQSGSILEISLGSSLSEHSSLIRAGGTWTLDSGLVVRLLGSEIAAGTYEGIITGLAGSVDTTEWSLSQEFNPGWEGSFSYNSVSHGIDMTISAIPEPSSWIFLAIASALILVRRPLRLTKLSGKRANI